AAALGPSGSAARARHPARQANRRARGGAHGDVASAGARAHRRLAGARAPVGDRVSQVPPRQVAVRRSGASGGARVSRLSFRRFIGIDLGGGRGKNTAVARLEFQQDDAVSRLAVAEAKVRYGQRGTGSVEEPEGDALFRDEVLVEYLARFVDDHTVVAINAPLTLPPCIPCALPCPTVAHCSVEVVAWMRTWAPRLLGRGRSDPHKPVVTPYTQRATEVLWAAAGVQPREALGQGTGPLAARAAYLRRALSPKLRLHEN